ncbi:hypothetical protein TNIN_134981 [Trichonephila inaurata madagascariensis]|uniref:Uncharacterized protein n=1 Tax=Trichonephila inaurata madagascariensis TaxID=2747483 RepID=A0A8X7CEX9_9ARAC|nr:hypothetical protein TNIN_134981 [Trichonephila inaurata madagascariensis]
MKTPRFIFEILTIRTMPFIGLSRLERSQLITNKEARHNNAVMIHISWCTFRTERLFNLGITLIFSSAWFGGMGWKPTLGPKDIAAQLVRKSPPAQASHVSRRQPNKQEDKKGWQGGNRNTEETSFHHSGTS